MKASEAGIELGTIVQLKSGGPKMTVYSIFSWDEGMDQAKCYFFNEDQTLANLTLPIITLKKL